MNAWIKLNDELPPHHKPLEVSDYAGRARLALYDIHSDRFYFDMALLKFRKRPDLWRLYQPPVAPTKLEIDSPSFAPTPKSDEPGFMLVGRDPIAPLLVEAWAYLRMGQFSMAQQALGRVMSTAQELDFQRNDDPQILSAFRVAGEMVSWARKKVLGG